MCRLYSVAWPLYVHLVHSQKVADLLYNHMFNLSLSMIVVQFWKGKPLPKRQKAKSGAYSFE